MNIILGEKEVPIITAVGHVEAINGVQRNIIELWTEEPLTAEDIEYIKTHDSFTNDVGGTYNNYKEVVRYSTWLAQVDPNAEVVIQKQAEIETLTVEKTAMKGAMVDMATHLPDREASRFVVYAQSLQGDGKLIKAGTRIQWEGVLKRAAVDLWDKAESTPAVAPNLWEDVAYHNGYRIIPETITATLAFAKDEVGYWPKDKKYYQAKADGTVWTPEAHAAAWTVYEVNEEEA